MSFFRVAGYCAAARLCPDTAMTPISRTVGNDQIVEEIILKFTHIMEGSRKVVPPE